jgi:hypothetical protein
MIKPTTFPEANFTFKKPPDMAEEDCGDLHVYKTVTSLSMGSVPCILSCWEISEEDLKEIIKTKRIWLGILGNGMPPVWLDGFKPIETPKLDDKEQLHGATTDFVQ